MNETVLSQEDIDSIIAGINSPFGVPAEENWFLSAWNNYEKEREKRISSLDKIIKERDDAIAFQAKIIDRIESALVENPTLKPHAPIIRQIIAQVRTASDYQKEHLTAS